MPSAAPPTRQEIFARTGYSTGGEVGDEEARGGADGQALVRADFTSSDLPLAPHLAHSPHGLKPARSGTGSHRSMVSLSHASSTTKYLIRTLEEKITDQRTQMAIKDKQIENLMGRISEGGNSVRSLGSVKSHPSTIKIDVNTRNTNATETRSDTTTEQAAASEARHVTVSLPAPEGAKDEDLEKEAISEYPRRRRPLARVMQHVNAPRNLGNWMLCFSIGWLVQSNISLRNEMMRNRKQDHKRRGIGSRAREMLRDKFDVLEMLG